MVFKFYDLDIMRVNFLLTWLSHDTQTFSQTCLDVAVKGFLDDTINQSKLLSIMWISLTQSTEDFT